MKQLMSSLSLAGLIFDHARKKGVILHMVNSYEPTGKIGAVFIGKDDDEINEMQKKLVKIIG